MGRKRRQLDNGTVRAILFQVLAIEIGENQGGDTLRNIIELHGGSEYDIDAAIRLAGQLSDELWARGKRANQEVSITVYDVGTNQ